MAIVLDQNEPAIRRAIKTVGVGKKGSKALDQALVDELFADLKDNKVSPVATGAFLAGLWVKGIEAHERKLEQIWGEGVFGDADLLVKTIAPQAPAFAQWISAQLLKGHQLDTPSARSLGQFLFSEQEGDALRGLVASLLRVRYETDDEYEGLWQAMQETIAAPFQVPSLKGEPIIQLAEPFDGNDHSYITTPLIAGFIQSKGYRAVTMVGRNSGPKFVLNVYGLMQLLPETSWVKGNVDFSKPLSSLGYYAAQHDLSAALDRWVDLRHQTIKRPFLATLEKFINPFQADIIITSAFHPPYGEKMITIGQRAGFRGVVVVRNGIEGGIGFSLKRETKVLVAARQADGQYKREEFNVDPIKILGQDMATEEKREVLNPKTNAALIRQYLEIGESGDEHFDARVKLTCEGLLTALDWLERNMV